MSTTTTHPTRTPTRRIWPLPTGLIVLAAVPVIAGAFRLTELAGGAEVTASNARFFASPVPVVLHIVSVTLFSVLGAFQFVSVSRRKMGWHRAAGRIVAPAGLIAALSGLWMTVFYALPAHDGALVNSFRLLFGSAMAVSIVLGFVAIQRRDIARHRAWMIRGYAIGMGAGTQVLTLAPATLLVGEPSPTLRGFLMAAAWVINLAVAEWFVRKSSARF